MWIDLKVQSTELSFYDWVTIITLCYAPLIVHIIAGVPSTTCFSVNRPPWHELICHYNPTSIVWRYCAIVNRRLRARMWDENDLAATNAIIWTRHGWDGSESMVESSRPFLIHAPKKSRLFSTSTLTTLVITFQGAQALDQVILAFQGNLLANNVSLDKIFSYIALLGLLRLPAAFWITSSYHYTEFNDAVHDMVNKQRKTGSGIELLETDETALIERHETSPHRIAQRFSPTQGWRGMFIRAFYFLFMGGLFTVSLMAFKPWMKIKYPLYTWNASGLGITILYQIISIMTVAILFFCFCSKRSSTTIIPCISHTWYKLYTIFLFAICTAVVIVAAVQTKKTPCGVYTAFTFGSGGLCGNSTFVGTPQGTADIVRPGANWFGIAPSEAFGIALRNKTGSSNETTDVVRIISVQGWCKVKKVESTQYARTMNMNVSTPLSHWWD